MTLATHVLVNLFRGFVSGVIAVSSHSGLKPIPGTYIPLIEMPASKANEWSPVPYAVIIGDDPGSVEAQAWQCCSALNAGIEQILALKPFHATLDTTHEYRLRGNYRYRSTEVQTPFWGSHLLDREKSTYEWRVSYSPGGITSQDNYGISRPGNCVYVLSLDLAAHILIGAAGNVGEDDSSFSEQPTDDDTKHLTTDSDQFVHAYFGHAITAPKELLSNSGVYQAEWRVHAPAAQAKLVSDVAPGKRGLSGTSNGKGTRRRTLVPDIAPGIR